MRVLIPHSDLTGLANPLRMSRDNERMSCDCRPIKVAYGHDFYDFL